MLIKLLTIVLIYNLTLIQNDNTGSQKIMIVGDLYSMRIQNTQVKKPFLSLKRQ